MTNAELDRLEGILQEEPIHPAEVLSLIAEIRKLRGALEFIGTDVWLSKYSGDVEWIRCNVQGKARAALSEGGE